jgi:hypothetical protein
MAAKSKKNICNTSFNLINGNITLPLGSPASNKFTLGKFIKRMTPFRPSLYFFFFSAVSSFGGSVVVFFFSA